MSNLHGCDQRLIDRYAFRTQFSLGLRYFLFKIHAYEQLLQCAEKSFFVQ